MYADKEPRLYPVKDGGFVTFYPPQGSDIRSCYTDAVESTLTLSGISNFDRHTRDLKSVTTTSIIVQDHTNEAVKKYDRT